MSREPCLVYEEDKVVLEFLGVREGGIVGEVEVVGFGEVFEGGGEGLGKSKPTTQTLPFKRQCQSGGGRDGSVGGEILGGEGV